MINISTTPYCVLLVSAGIRNYKKNKKGGELSYCLQTGGPTKIREVDPHRLARWGLREADKYKGEKNLS